MPETDREGEGRPAGRDASRPAPTMLSAVYESDTLPEECAQVAQSVWDFLDGRLTPTQEDDFRRHLDACAPCLRYSEFQRQVLAHLAARPRGRENPELRARILEALHDDGYEGAAG